MLFSGFKESRTVLSSSAYRATSGDKKDVTYLYHYMEISTSSRVLQ
jgi:hypothetical protein